ncbi:MAG TPA: 23S rRNA (uracil(1939)-C(5))-methyltransferase RlmD [Saprospiraceae bacterium]|nr:23S rRNA (uracil(1939)-C(5))-methyltransferase RlmD [Saprospiraceae bacterium]HMP15059.1 23S rRNA (uracil(1939)-C(5))-methyltransferase RlmD [Saprospiraceae bacterium]
MKKRKVLQHITITGIADKGKSVGRTASGEVIFVEDVAPGDVVDVLVLRKKSGVMQGKPVHFHQYSADRVQPFCKHYGVCGGCKWQHLDYAAQLQHKQQVTEDAIQRIAKVKVIDFQNIIGGTETVYYRNKLEFAFSDRRWLTEAEIHMPTEMKYRSALGFHRPGAFDKIVDIEHCWLQPEPSNTIRNTIKAIAMEQGLRFYDVKAHQGLLRNMTLRIATTGEIMLLLSFGEDQPKKIRLFLETIQQRLPDITTICYCINTKVNDYIMDLEMITWYGKGYIEEQLGHVRCKIGPKSFFQTNTRQGQLLYDIALQFADLQGNENVYDLYTGVGSIALYVARHCRQVVGIEEMEAAIEDARENAALNNITNAIFYAGDVKNILTEAFVQQYGKPDVLITDPPRAGMHPDVVQMLLQLEAPKIVYVSCNPATQARDLQMLSAKYEVHKVRPVDMFPHTHHIENVALLKRLREE